MAVSGAFLFDRALRCYGIVIANPAVSTTSGWPAGLWRGFAIRDGNLATGQQNFSSAETARAVVEALEDWSICASR